MKTKMWFKNVVVARSPKFVAQLARSIRHLELLTVSSPLLVRKLVKGGSPIKLELGAGKKKGANGWTTLDRTPGCDLL